MRLILILVVLLAAAGALFATNPPRQAFEAQVEAILLAEIDGMQPGEARDEVEELLLGLCQLGREGCARLIRSAMDLRIEDRLFYSVADLSLADEPAGRCYGLLTRVICR